MNTENLHFLSNRVRDIVECYHKELDCLYGKGEVTCFLELLFDAYLDWTKVRLLTSKEETINQSELLRFHWALEDLKKQRPIQHIIGYCDFCGCHIQVNPDVLIPRPETEEIVQWVLSSTPHFHQQQTTITQPPQPAILDLCTGSGCIAIALKKALPNAYVAAVDLSEAALSTARINAQTNGTDIHFIQDNILQPKRLLDNNNEIAQNSRLFSLLISNPPYVRNSERTSMCDNVLCYEPATALFVPDENPLLFYHAIVHIAQFLLQEDGMLVVETNAALTEETCDILHRQGFAPTPHRDFRGQWRWITACRANQ